MENFIEKIKNISKRVEKMQGTITTEEATKTSIIMPFFQAMGYDIFNPEEFLPEFVADVGIKKGEKVDFAIMHDGKPVILIEAKSITEKLHKHDSQLFRYFGTTSAKFAILTNGLTYRFYTDLEEQNKMDAAPFFEFNLIDIKEASLIELAKFRKDSFDLESIFSTASDLKYTNAIKTLLSENFNSPTEEFISFIVSQVYQGRKTKNVLDNFEILVKQAFKQYINEMVNEKLNAAIKSTSSSNAALSTDINIIDTSASEAIQAVEDDNKPAAAQITTTEEEIEGYALTKFLLQDVIDVSRISYRDNLSYFNILIDNNIRRWVCRLHFNSANKYIQFNDEEKANISLENITDIAKYKDKLIEVASKHI